MEFQMNNFIKREKRKIIFGGEYCFLTKIFASDPYCNQKWKFLNLVFQNKDWKIIDRDLWLQGSRPPAKAAWNTEDLYTITSCMAIPVLPARVMCDAGLQPACVADFSAIHKLLWFVSRIIWGGIFDFAFLTMQTCQKDQSYQIEEVDNYKASLLAWANDFQPYKIFPGSRNWMHLKYNCK